MSFSSPKLKTKVSFPDHPLSVCPSVCLSVFQLTFHIFDLSITTGPILTRFNTMHSQGKGIQVCSYEIDTLSPRADNIKIVKKY
jgi:hypothetical protein